jgi:uncharacterized protein YndB with AHSA1/START domain
MARNYSVATRIERPVGDVYDAVVSGARLTRYFANETSGNLREGERITWRFSQWGAYSVVVKKLVSNRLIELTLDSKEWKKTEDESYEVVVRMEFEELEDGGTMLTISEEGWKTDPPGLKGSHENCSGWTHMAMCLKGYIEHGIDLR